MIDIPTKYMSSVFGNFTDIIPSPEIISKMLNLFRDKNLLPSTFQEISPAIRKPEIRLSLSSSNNEWNISFATFRIDVEKQPLDIKGKSLGTVEEFEEEACEIFNRILSEFNKKGNRISLIAGGLLKEMTQQKLDDIYSRLFKPTKFYSDNKPSSWDFRSVARVDLNILGSQEKVNVITQINRKKGRMTKPDAVIEFDRMEVNFDINTIPENQDIRFDINSIKSFFSEVNSVRSQIIDQLEGFINV